MGTFNELTAGLLARVRGWSLDRQLATGSVPESSRLLTARARYIVELESRRSLADNWERILTPETRPSSRAAVRVRSDAVAAAEPEIRRLIEYLREPLPVPARGVAMASQLLTDFSGPLFQGSGETPLPDALALACSFLDPTLPLQ